MLAEILLLAAAAPNPALVAGPPAPVASNVTATTRAMRRYASDYGPPPPPLKPCRPQHMNEIVVCGVADERGPDRLPPRSARGAADGPRGATGDVPPGDAGEGPVPTLRNGTVVATFGMGKAARMHNETLKLIYAEEHAKEAEAERQAAERAKEATPSAPAAAPE